MQYKELDLHQHCLHRPDTYLGSIQLETRDDYVYSDDAINRREIQIIPAIERLFVEALSNAIDNKWRSDTNNTPSTAIKITIEETGRTSIWNDGMWIPIEKNESDVWIPQMIFGQLLTSSNYDDTEDRYTSGRNGIGIKAVNIFSTEFSIECADPSRGLIYKQKWGRNMCEVGKPTIKSKKIDTGYTRVEWVPDFTYFHSTEARYSDDMMSLLYRHAYDTAMITNIPVYLNKRKIPVKQFKDYVKLFMSSDTPNKECLVCTPNERITFALIPSEGSFDHVSFVNGIHTRNGGVHLDACVDAVLKPLLSTLQSKLKKLTMRELKAQFRFFVNCSVPNPKFESQTKTKLTSPKIPVSITESDWKPVTRWSFIDRLKEKLEMKEEVSLQKSERSRGYVVIPGYERANKEGSKQSWKCSLILCEGLSAKTYAMTGIQNGVDFGGELGHLKGKDWFGVAPLKGKCFIGGTLVRMADGSIKPIEKIKIGDAVMGDHFGPRVVKATICGEEKMYRVDQSNGDSYTVTSDHLLVLHIAYKPSISWVNFKWGWRVDYFDITRCRLSSTFFQCCDDPARFPDPDRRPPDRDTGFSRAQTALKFRKVDSLRISVYDYLKLDESVKKILFGIRLSKTPIYNKVKYIYNTLSITEVGIDEFYGISLVGHPKFLLKDGTVVHNCLNVRNASKSSIAGNAEITNLIQALGLRYGVDYTVDANYRTLRYGRIIALADGDDDGLHVQALVLNIFHVLFPSLMKRPDFFFNMLTPIVRIESKGRVHRFYTMADAKKYLLTAPNNVDIKYYKGLGSADTKDIKETFGSRVLMYTESGSEDTSSAMKLAFDKSFADERKNWLRVVPMQIEPTALSSSLFTKPMNEFLTTELVLFSLADCHRSLPNLYDGLKVSQRKILFGCLEKNLTSDKRIKVSQLSGYVSEITDYHHGEVSLQGAITEMAQDFVGSNNIPLLLKDGAVGCLAPNTEILLWNGGIKMAKDIVIGDRLVGDDGESRTVLNTISGVSDMYTVRVNRLENFSYTVTGNHLLTLRFNIHKKIYHHNPNSWRVTYYDHATSTFKSLSRAYNISTHFNAASRLKEDAYIELENQLHSIPDRNILDIQLYDYLNLPVSIQRLLSMVSNMVPINWIASSVELDPYILGSWLGDGASDGTAITSADPEIVQYWCYWAETVGAELVHAQNNSHEGYTYKVRRKGAGTRIPVGHPSHSSSTCAGCLTSKVQHPTCDWTNPNFSEINVPCDGKNVNGDQRHDANPFIEILKTMGILGDKRIPNNYIYNTPEVRLQVLAGFIDTDGCRRPNHYSVSQCEQRAYLLVSLQFIARSLGYHTTLYKGTPITRSTGVISTMLELVIRGDNLWQIPVKIARKKITCSTYKPSVITIEKAGTGSFHGWSVDSNERFLLGNFVVTHNSRLALGADAASARYVFVKLGKKTRDLFSKLDDDILEYIEDEGRRIEPYYYMPVLPMLLVNGCVGIGTGWSTNIPAYNPSDLKEWIREWINSKEKGNEEKKTALELIPWYNGFKGTIERVSASKYSTYGVLGIDDQRKNTVIVSELPIGMSIDKFKEFCEELLVNKKIKGFKNDSCPDPEKILFTIETLEGWECTLESLKLKSTINTTNLVVLSDGNEIVKYSSVDEIMQDFCTKRLEMYGKRRLNMVRNLTDEHQLLFYRLKFLQQVMKKEIQLFKQPEAEVIKILEEGGYPRRENSYAYLLDLPVRQFTEQKLVGLMNKLEQVKGELEYWNTVSERKLWLDDLESI